MDPDEALKIIREHAAALNGDGLTTEEVVHAGLDMAEAFDGLDGWLSRDGFLPAAWVSDEEKNKPGWIDRVLATVGEWSDEEFHQAFGFDR